MRFSPGLSIAISALLCQGVVAMMGCWRWGCPQSKLQPHWRSNSSMDFPNILILFVLPFPYKLRAFAKVFQPESSEHRNEQAQSELGWELFDYSAWIWARFPRKTAQMVFRELACWGDFWNPFFPCPKISAPNPRHPKSPNPQRGMAFSHQGR